MTTYQNLKTPVGDDIVWDNHGCMPLKADVTLLPQLERYRNAGVSIGGSALRH
jgi:membrane dipeptidase